MTDNVCKLSMGETRQFCEQEGIKLHTSVQYSPESNGVAEHMIGMLTNAMHAMLHNLGLPMFLWAEAYNTVTDLHNRMLTRVLGGHTLYEVLYGMKSDISHLCTFRVPCTIIEPKEWLKKLDDSMTMCFFMGYKYKGGSYRVWDLKRQVVVKLETLFSLRKACCHPPLTTHHFDPLTRMSK